MSILRLAKSMVGVTTFLSEFNPYPNQFEDITWGILPGWKHARLLHDSDARINKPHRGDRLRPRHQFLVESWILYRADFGGDFLEYALC